MSARTALVNAARGLVKSYGERLRKCHTQQVRREMTGALSAGLREALEPMLREAESLNERIQEYDRRIEKMAKQTYPEWALLKQLIGVGDLIATTYVLWRSASRVARLLRTDSRHRTLLFTSPLLRPVL
ncbi:MAG: hypothetical protein WBL50_00440 [Candidatus Acidiferrum sp.]